MVKLLETVILFVVIFIAGFSPELLLIVRLLKTFAVDPAMDCTPVPTRLTPLVTFELSVNVPLLIKSPDRLKVPPLFRVTEAPLLIVRLRVAAFVPNAIIGMNKPEPEGKGLMTTSVVLVGTELLHQFEAVPQLFVVPFQPPPDNAVTLTAAERLVQPPLVIATRYQVVTARPAGDV